MTDPLQLLRSSRPPAEDWVQSPGAEDAWQKVRRANEATGRSETSPEGSGPRRVRRSTVIGLVATLAVASAGTALAATGHPLQTLGITRSPSERADIAANTVAAYAQSHPGSGYVNVIEDPAKASISVVWRGPVPADLRRQLDHADVGVSYITARFDEQALEKATRKLLLPSTVATLLRCGVGSAGFGPSGDGQGLNFAYYPLPGKTVATPDTIRRVVLQITGVPVAHLSEQSGPGETLPGRLFTPLPSAPSQSR